MAEETRDRKLVVEIVQPKKTQKSFDLTLPADVRAYAATADSTRGQTVSSPSGTADINDRVKKGDIIADHRGAGHGRRPRAGEGRAQPAAEAHYELTAVTDERYKGLIGDPCRASPSSSWTSSSRRTQQAQRRNVGSSAAEVDRRYQASSAFERVRRPVRRCGDRQEHKHG